ncbi:transposase family protein [Micromonospora sp. LZ34]
MIKTVFPLLSGLVIDGVIDQGAVVRVVARTPVAPVPCSGCGQLSDRVHAYHQRRLADLFVGGRCVVVQLRVRRLVCRAGSCPRRRFREQVPALTPRWARRTRQLTALVADPAVAVRPGRRGGAVPIGCAGLPQHRPAGADDGGAQRRRLRAVPGPPVCDLAA